MSKEKISDADLDLIPIDKLDYLISAIESDFLNIGKIDSDEQILFVRADNIESNLEDERPSEFNAENTNFNESSIRFSILSKKIVAFDSLIKTWMEKGMTYMYRPYYISFICESTTIPRELLKNRWLLAKFKPLGSKQKVDISKKYELHGILETHSGGNEYLINDILFSDSPLFTPKNRFHYIQGKLVFLTGNSDNFMEVNDSYKDEIQRTYGIETFKASDNSCIEEELQRVWTNDNARSIIVYNIGKGNANYVRGKKARMLYDIGHDYRRFKQNPRTGKYSNASAVMSSVKPDVVVLSHWDSDHILSAAYANYHTLNVKWIAPTFHKRPSANALRLASYLAGTDKLLLVDRNQQEQLIANITCSGNSYIKLWIGSGISHLSDSNKKGLLLEIVSHLNCHQTKALLTGDVPYNCIPNNALNEVDLLIVPHHCSKMEMNRFNSTLFSSEPKAIISTSVNSLNQPNYYQDHYNELLRNHQVYHTFDTNTLMIYNLKDNLITLL